MNQTIRSRIEQIKRGEIPEGYEKTPFGIFPCDWEKSTLKKLGEFAKGKGIPGEKMKNEGIPCVGYGDIYMKYNYHFNQAKSFIDRTTADESIQVGIDTLLFTGTGETAEEIGKCVCYTGSDDIYVGGDIIIFNSVDVSPVFIAYQQYLPFAIKQKAGFGQGHSVVHIYKSDLEKLYCAYPKSKAEQEKIAEILQEQDRLIELKEKLIEEKKKQKQYLMEVLLTGKVRLPGFTDKWRKVRLKTILKERNDYAVKDGEYPHVTLSTEGIYLKNERYNRDFLVKTEEKEYKITHDGDICYNPANLKFGVICVNDFGDAIFSPIYVTFEVAKTEDFHYIGNYMCRNNFINAVRKYEEGTVYERMSVKPQDMLLFTISLPTLPEQKAISNVLSKADDELALLQTELEEQKRKKQSLMQLLLTGIVRV